MECVIPKGNLKVFTKILQCMSKVGEDLNVESTKEHVIFTTLNHKQSCFMKFLFKPAFFDRYVRMSHGPRKFSVNLKILNSVFRSSGTLELVELKVEQSKLNIYLHGQFQIQKIYRLNTESSDAMQAVYEKDFILKLRSDPILLFEVLNNFHKSVKEISFVLEHNSEVLDVKTYWDEDLKLDQLLVTNSYIGLKDFQGTDPENYLVHTRGRIEQTFNIKDIKAFVSFCSFTAQPIDIYLRMQGSPILFTSSAVNNNNDIECDLLLATLQSKAEDDNSSTAGSSTSRSSSQQATSMSISSPTQHVKASTSGEVSSYGTPDSARRRDISVHKRLRDSLDGTPENEQNMKDLNDELHISPPSSYPIQSGPSPQQLHSNISPASSSSRQLHQEYQPFAEGNFPEYKEAVDESPSPPSKKQKRLDHVFDVQK